MDEKVRCKPHIKFCAFCFCIFFTLCACSRPQNSSLKLYLENSASASDSAFRAVSLKALNKNAQSAVIADPDKAPLMFFAFDTSSAARYALQSLIASGGYALELEIESPLSRSGAVPNGGRNAEKEGGFFFGFIYGKDIASDSNRSLAKYAQSIEPRTGIKGGVRQPAHFKASLGFESAGTAQSPADIRGFMIYSQVPLTVKTAKITKACYGKSRSEGIPWFGFSAIGGSIAPGTQNAESAVQKVFFRQLPPLAEDECRELHIQFFSENSDTARNNSELRHAEKKSAEQNTVELLCGSERLSVLRHRSMRTAIIDMRAFSHNFDTVEVVSGSSLIESIVVKQKKLSPFSPVTADPGLIVDWPQKNVRGNQFELFSWHRFPSVLIFDFADYAVQDAFFKRLAFYVEKKGYAGALLTDKDMDTLHGFNAHDYRAESLASFFNQAERERFTLNKSELLLRDILFANGVIMRSAKDIVPGKGAVISISRESPRYLRRLFLTHEGLHGIYFTEQSFRTVVDGVFRNLAKRDAKSLAFLRRYFEVTPSLNYNTADGYLLKNEFMAYLLQQRSSGVKRYFTEVLSKRRYISAAEPELCDYIRSTEAQGLVEAAQTMSDFLYDAWGVEGGDIFSVRIK